MWLLAGVVPSALVVTTLMAPLPEQISCMDWGLTNGDAIATPMDKANQTSTKRAISLALRNWCMGRLLQLHQKPFDTRFQVTSKLVASATTAMPRINQKMCLAD